jgi:5-deoxy-glucuronate isomerase
MTLLRHAATVRSGAPAVSVTPDEAGFRYLSFAAYQLDKGGTLTGRSPGQETALVVLGGRCAVRSGHSWFPDVGERPDVWARTPAHVVLLPPDSDYEVQSKTPLHLAIASAPPTPTAAELPARQGTAPRHITPEQVAVEHRGEGQTYRYIQHLLPPAAQAASLILVEVYTPAGNWSSFPPHKHDEEDPPRESCLEEVYYYQLAPRTGFALQRVYTPDRSLDETLAPGDGDLVLVPRGYHPVAATPGHECYYLNVMAGPTRAWNFAVDPDYAHLMNWQKPPVAGEQTK